MAEGKAFAEMLTGHDPNAAPFDLHKIDRDCNGVEKTTKVDKEAVAQKTKMGSMAREVTEDIFDQTYFERIKWIEDQRLKGNELFKKSDYALAIDEYMKCLCALDFSSCKGYIDPTTEAVKKRDEGLDKSLWITKAKEGMAQIQMKVPVLNNMAQCLIRMDHHARAIDMLDQVLDIDSKNCKATARKIICMMKLGHH